MIVGRDRASVVVIGIGNSMRRDDGVGQAVIDALADEHLHAELVSLDGEPTRIIEAWRHRRRAIVVDAITAGTAPGTIHRLDGLTDDLPRWSAGSSSHRAGLAEAVALGRTLDRLPDQLVVCGVEPADLTHGPGLSSPVADAMPALVTMVRDEIRP